MKPDYRPCCQSPKLSVATPHLTSSRVHHVVIADCSKLLKYNIGVPLNGITFVSYFVKISKLVQNVNGTHTHRQHVTKPTSFLREEERTLKTFYWLITSTNQCKVSLC
jgi:hypothetical protein